MESVYSQNQRTMREDASHDFHERSRGHARVREEEDEDDDDESRVESGGDKTASRHRIAHPRVLDGAGGEMGTNPIPTRGRKWGRTAKSRACPSTAVAVAFRSLGYLWLPMAIDPTIW